MSKVNKRWVCDCQPVWWGRTELEFGSPHLDDDDNDGDGDACVFFMTPPALDRAQSLRHLFWMATQKAGARARREEEAEEKEEEESEGKVKAGLKSGGRVEDR